MMMSNSAYNGFDRAVQYLSSLRRADWLGGHAITAWELSSSSQGRRDEATVRAHHVSHAGDYLYWHTIAGRAALT